MTKIYLDELDKQILGIIAKDARVPFLEVARACNVSGAAIHQRIAKMQKMGVIKGSQFCIDPEKVGYETCAYIGLFLKNPEKFDKVVKELEKIPEVVECHYTTGAFDMFVKIYALNNHHLLNIIHDKLQPLGLSRSETIISFNVAFDRQIPIPDFDTTGAFAKRGGGIRGMIVCIAEKPSVAKDIARIIGATKQHDGYLEGNGYQVTWTFGHLCTLKEPDDYTPLWKPWSLVRLPMIPERFGIKLIDDTA